MEISKWIQVTFANNWKGNLSYPFYVSFGFFIMTLFNKLRRKNGNAVILWFSDEFWHSHKTLKDILKGSLHRVLFAAELKFPKMFVKGSLCDQPLGALVYLHFIVLKLICFSLIMPGRNHVIYGCSFLRKNKRISLFTIKE